jgi:hypothetical protein
MEVNFYWLVLGSLGVWRVTYLLTAESGPWHIFERLRQLSRSGFWGGLTGCFYCLSLWAAAPFALLLTARWQDRILLWLGLSAAAILLERATAAREPVVQPASYTEDEEVHDVLRKE